MALELFPMAWIVADLLRHSAIEKVSKKLFKNPCNDWKKVW
jgi:hypothetical protein